MEDITSHISSSFEERCKCLENLTQEFKNMLRKTTFQHRKGLEIIKKLKSSRKNFA
jgi:hypothetical protein